MTIPTIHPKKRTLTPGLIDAYGADFGGPSVVTRIAPSPTGDMHIGTARTALFNYLYAKHMGGKFMLRVEDTDRERSTKESVDVILDGLKWLGLDYDGDVVFQSANYQRHIRVVFDLIDRGMAYKCYMTADAASAWKAENKGKAFRSPYRDMADQPHDGDYVVRFKVPVDKDIVVNDLVKGPITFTTANLDDIVLLRSDGSPTYNLAVVVDDHDMGITHVIRGDDHVNNTPRQIMIYDAMDWVVPQFAHLPMILGEDGKPLSKRHGAASVLDFADAGYLPSTMRNYLARLGWGHGDADIFSDAEAIAWFDLPDVVSSPARMNTKKLFSVNQHYINATDNDTLTGYLLPLLNKRGIWLDEHIWRGRFENEVVALLKPGARTLNELVDAMMFVIRPITTFEPKAEALLADPTALSNLRWVYGVIDCAVGVDGWWTVDQLNMLIHDAAEKDSIKMKEIGPVLRAALTGKTSAPDLGTCLFLLGETESVLRIKTALGEI
jgi:glutamyl-tRNA synthetase